MNHSLRSFNGFNALEINCKKCRNINSLNNDNCIDCINNLELSFDLLELKKELSKVYYANNLSTLIKKRVCHNLKCNVVPVFLNFYIIPCTGEEIDSINKSLSVINSGVPYNFLEVNPPEYNLSPEDARLVSSFVNKIQTGEVSAGELNDLVPEPKKHLIKLIVRYTHGLGVIEEFLKVPSIQDVFINSPGNDFVYCHHSEFNDLKSNIVLKKEMINKLSTFLRTRSGRPFDEAYPVLHTNIKSFKSRVCGIMNPLSFNGTGFAIRRHSHIPFTLTKLVKKDFLDPELAGLLWFLADSETSLLITGARGSGKTTLLGALLFEISSNSRMIIIEDTAELPVPELRSSGFNIEHLKTSSFINSGFELSPETALKTALRLGESVLVIGEVRGGEAKSLFEAMRVGAAGNCVLGTIHGSNAYDTYDRVVNDLGIPPTSFKACDIVISCANLRIGDTLNRVRKITGVSEVGEKWVDNPRFDELVSFDSVKKEFSFNNLRNSSLIKRIAFSKGFTVKKLISNIKLRSKIKEYVVSKSIEQNDDSFLSPSSTISQNNKFTELVSKYDYDKAFSKFCSWFDEEFLSGNDFFEDKESLIIKCLKELKATSKESGVGSKELFESLNNMISRTRFNELLHSLELKDVVKNFSEKNKVFWYLE